MFSVYDISLSFVLVRMPGALGYVNRSNFVSHDLLCISVLHHELSDLCFKCLIFKHLLLGAEAS